MTAPDLAALRERVRVDRDYTALTGAIPYLRFLGIRLEERDGALLGKMVYSPKLIGNAALPALHGGTIGGLLESTGVLELILNTEVLHVPKIITLTIDYLRSGRAVDTWAHASITRQGRRVANVRVDAWQEDPARPIATAHALFLLSQ